MPASEQLLAAIQSVAHMLPNMADLDAGLRKTLEVAIEAVDATGGSILFHDPVEKRLCFRHVLGGTAAGSRHAVGIALTAESIAEDEGIAGQVFTTGNPSIVNNVAGDPKHKKEIDQEFGFETERLATVPIRFPGGNTIGVLQLLNKQSGDFTAEDLIVLDIIGVICAMSIALHQRGVSEVEIEP